jgi:DNA-binding NarL/FixJ family response regulator
MLLRRVLEAHPGWQVCGEAANGPEAIETVRALKPDVVIVDLAMPGMNGMQAAQEMLRTSPNLPILLLSVLEVSPKLVTAAKRLGFRGAVTKASGREVLEAVEALLRAETFFLLEQSNGTTWESPRRWSNKDP